MNRAEIDDYYSHRLQDQERGRHWAFNFRGPDHQHLCHRVLLEVDAEWDSVLDYGCGTGDLATLIPPGVTYRGCDISTRAIDQARAAYPDLDFENTDRVGQADLVVACGVLTRTHLDPTDLVHAFYRAAQVAVAFNCNKHYATIEEAEAWCSPAARRVVRDDYDEGADFTIYLYKE